MTKVLLAHPGTQYSYHTAAQINKIGYLQYFCTGFAIADSFFGRMLTKFFPTLKRRFVKTISSRQLKTNSLLELHALIEIRRGHFYEDVFRTRNEKFQKTIPDEYIKNVDAVICFDTTSWILAERTKKHGKKFILDVSIGHPLYKEKVFSTIKDTYPEWSFSVKPKKEEYIQDELREMELADIIVVPSGFVKDTYVQNGIAPEKIRVNPFGTDIRFFQSKKHIIKSPDELVFLFFGALNARKGLPLLLKAWSTVSQQYHAKLFLAGFDTIPSEVMIPKNVVVLGQIAPKDRPELFHRADVFVFPSFFEGFAQVQIEAAASGLPLIASYNSGGEEIIEEGKNGFIIDVNDISTLETAMKYFFEHPEKISEMGKRSREIAESFTWDAYGDRWKKIIDENSN